MTLILYEHMKWLKRKTIKLALMLAIAASLALANIASYASDSFIHIYGKDLIVISGNQRIPDSIVYTKLQFKQQTPVTEKQISDSAVALSASTYFEDAKIRVDEQGVMHIRVFERPLIADITINGNDKLQKSVIEELLKQTKIQKNSFYARAQIERFKSSLLQTYAALGHNEINIKIDAAPTENNSISLHIDIIEGFKYYVQAIDISGNYSFSNERLERLMQLSFKRTLNSSNFYSPIKFEGDLERIRDFYHNNGYLDYRLNGSRAVIDPVTKRINAYLDIHEGSQWTVGQIDIKIPQSTLDLSQAQVNQQTDQAINFDLTEAFMHIKVATGDVANRSVLAQSVEGLRDYLTDQGYPWAQVQSIENTNQSIHQIDFIFLITPGIRSRVRNIEVTGNANTSEIVIRSYLRIDEGSPFTGKNLKLSQERLLRTGLFDDVKVNYKRVVDSGELVDINVTVIERNSSHFRVGGGWQVGTGILLTAGVKINNFGGLGDELSLDLERTDETESFALGFKEPILNGSGLSRNTILAFETTDSQDSSVSSSYVHDESQIKQTYGIPLNEYNTLFVSLNLKYDSLKSTQGSPDYVLDFVDAHPYNLALLAELGWSFDDRDDVIFPSLGKRLYTNLESTIYASELRYATATVGIENYISLSNTWTFFQEARFSQISNLGYDEQLPIFYRHYKAGGLGNAGAVRGYDYNSIPNNIEDPDNIGGDRRLIGRMELLYDLDNLESGVKKSRRWGFFLDAGKIWLNDESLSFDHMRFSVGTMLYWFTPVGPFSFSYGIALNPEDEDVLSRFQMSWGSKF